MPVSEPALLEPMSEQMPKPTPEPIKGALSDDVPQGPATKEPPWEGTVSTEDMNHPMNEEAVAVPRDVEEKELSQQSDSSSPDCAECGDSDISEELPVDDVGEPPLKKFHSDMEVPNVEQKATVEEQPLPVVTKGSTQIAETILQEPSDKAKADPSPPASNQEADVSSDSSAKDETGTSPSKTDLEEEVAMEQN